MVLLFMKSSQTIAYMQILFQSPGCAKVIRESQRIGETVCQPLKFPETVDGRNPAPDNRYVVSLFAGSLVRYYSISSINTTT